MDTLRGRYVHEHGTGAIITNGSDNQGSPACSKVFGPHGIGGHHGSFETAAELSVVCVWVLGTGKSSRLAYATA